MKNRLWNKVLHVTELSILRQWLTMYNNYVDKLYFNSGNVVNDEISVKIINEMLYCRNLKLRSRIAL